MLACITDQPGLLQLQRRLGHAFAAHAQHVGDQLLRHLRDQRLGVAQQQVQHRPGQVERFLIEGFTDVVGGADANEGLLTLRESPQRACGPTQGCGEALAVASNDTGEGRQLSRRVEGVVSDDTGTIAPR